MRRRSVHTQVPRLAVIRGEERLGRDGVAVIAPFLLALDGGLHTHLHVNDRMKFTYLSVLSHPDEESRKVSGVLISRPQHIGKHRGALSGR